MSGPRWLGSMRRAGDWHVGLDGSGFAVKAGEDEIAAYLTEDDARFIAAWCPANAARLLALADRMAEALADFADERHQQRAGSHICDWCGHRWPCDTAQAIDVLRAWREAAGSADTSADSPAR